MKMLKFCVILIISQVVYTCGMNDFLFPVSFLLNIFFYCFFSNYARELHVIFLFDLKILALIVFPLRSHHEKIVIVDNQVCYIGGLDLCFGRYDSPEHKIADSPPVMWPGKDYYNPR